MQNLFHKSNKKCFVVTSLRGVVPIGGAQWISEEGMQIRDKQADEPLDGHL